MIIHDEDDKHNIRNQRTRKTQKKERRLNVERIHNEAKLMVMKDSDMSLYQLGVSASIEQRLVNHARPDKDKFRKMWNEYEHRIDVLCQVNPDWKETYSQIMFNAYKGTINKYNKQEEK